MYSFNQIMSHCSTVVLSSWVNVPLSISAVIAVSFCRTSLYVLP